MRLLYHTAHLSDADLAGRALERLSPPVRVEACASVRDVLARYTETPPPDALLLDTSPPAHEPLKALAEIRAAHPDALVIALVRPGADTLAVDALIAGADETLVKHREFFLQAPAAVARVRARRSSGAAGAPPHVLAVVPDGHLALEAASDLRVTRAEDDWWTNPAEQTLAARPDVLLLADAPGTARVAAAIRTLRDRASSTPVVLLAGEVAPDRAVCERIGVAAVVGASDYARLPDIVRSVTTTSRLTAQVAVLRAKEHRLRAIIESVPASVVLATIDGQVLAMNVTGLALIGAGGAGDIVGRSMFSLADAPAVEDLRAFVTRVCQGAPGLARFSGRALDGTPKTFEIRAVPMPRDQDTTVMLGVMRIAPAASPASAGGGAALGMTAGAHPAAATDEAAVRAELDTLREALAKERLVHAGAQQQLEDAGTRQAIQEAAWAAVQAELQRKLILQASLPDREAEHERARALLEQAVRERDQRLLSLSEALQQAEGGLQDAAEQIARLREAAEAHDDETVSLQAIIDVGAGREQELLRALAARDAELTGLQSEIASARQALADDASEIHALHEAADSAATREQDLRQQLAERDATIESVGEQVRTLRQALVDRSAELETLRATADQQAKEHTALLDVRQQMARLQAAAATAEQQERALEEANDRIQRLRTALEDALGTHRDLERTVQERDAELDGLRAERDAADARARTLEGDLAALAARADEPREDASAREAIEAIRAERDAARAEAAQWLTRARAAEDQAARLPDLHAQVEQWRTRFEGARGSLEATFAELTETRRGADRAQHLAADLAELREAHARMRREAEDTTARLRGTETELEAARRRTGDLEAATASLEAARAALAGDLETARDALASLQALHAELQAAMTAGWEARAALATREADAISARDETAAALAAQQAHTARLQADITRLEAEAASLRQGMAAHEADVAALQAARNEAQAALALERERRAALEALAAAASSARDEALALLATRDSEAAQARELAARTATELDTLRSTMAAADGQRADDLALLDEQRERIAALEAELAARHAALAAADQAARSLRVAVTEAEAAREQAERQLAAGRETQRAVLDDQQALRDQIADLQAQLAGQRQLAADVDADRAALREKMARADASSQLLASRQREAHDALERTTAELRERLADLESTMAGERAALEQTLASRDAAFRRLSQSGVVGLATTTAEGALLRCNDALAGFCGLASADDLLRRAGEAGLPLVNDWPAFASLVASSAVPVTVESSVQRPDGGVAWLQASAIASGAPASSAHIEWTIVDATDRYLRLRQQRQGRRLEAVRDLAISAGGELLEALGSRPPETLPGLVPAGSGVDARNRAREIVQQLVAFAQKHARPAHLVDLGEQAAHLRLTLVRLVGEDVSLSLEVPPRPLVVTADPAELDHWITSLGVVLRDALPAMGTIAVSVTPRDLVMGAATGAPRVAPVATLSLRATGYGVRAVTVPLAVQDAVSQRGGVLRSTHDAIGGAATVEIHLPAVVSLSGADAPFPLQARRQPV